MHLPKPTSNHKEATYCRKIIHVDMDAFYVSVEVRDNPSLQDKPVAVGGSRVARGVLSTCNYIAREFGVRSAMPTGMALKKCPHLVVVPGRMDVYKVVSKHLRTIFERYTMLIEPLSLDEAYLDVTDCQMFNGSATLIANDIRETIYKELSLTASAGIAPLKFLAKVASDLNKPNGQFVIPPSEVYNFIANLPLNKISGVGKVTFEKLKSLGLEYGKDIQNADPSFINENMGKFGKVLYQRCQGIDNRGIETTRIRKSVGVERTFAEDIDDINTLQRILLETLIPELKKRTEKYIQANGSSTGSPNREINKIGIKVKFSDFHQTTKDHSVDDFSFGVDPQFEQMILYQLLEEAVTRGKGKKVRLLGVHVGLKNKEEKQEDNQLKLRF